MPRSLLPREHGAYVQLAAPLLGALVTFGASLGGVLIAIAACLAFIANEPLLVLLGHRGKRMQAESGGRARRLLAVLLPAAGLAGLAGLVRAPASLHAVGILLVPTAVLLAFAWKKRERTFAGELVAAVALSGASAPVAVAAGASLSVAIFVWMTWALGYAWTVVAVHRVIARHRRRAAMIDALAIVGWLAAACALVAFGLWPALPLAACSIGLLILAPAASHLRTIGFVLVGASSISIVVLAQTLG
jgi:hypothetical protein